ncbi:MAG TPA: hypothetical protein VGB07_25110 [Blastocatellia bacterium]
MFTARITPKVVLIGLAIQLGLWLAVNLPWTFGWTSRHFAAAHAMRLVMSCLALGLACAINLEIAEEYRNAPWLRVAWLALAANAGISILRMIAETPLWEQSWPGYGPSLRGLLQHLAIVPANFALLVGVAAMCWAYHQVGLGFEIERRDWLMMSGVAALLIALMTFREGLTEAQSPFVTSRYLQLSGLILLALATAVSIILQRMAAGMGGGRLAMALRVLTVYLLLRAGLVLLGALHPERFISPTGNILRRYFFELGWQTLLWLPALAAAYRAELTLHAARELAQQRADKAALVSA